MTIMRRVSGVFFAAAFAMLWSSVVVAQSSIFVCASADGNDIQGDATHINYQNCSVALNAGESATIPNDGKTVTGSPQLRPFRIIKRVDRASALWRQALVQGQSLDVSIHFLGLNPDGSGAEIEIWTVTLLNARAVGLTASTADNSSVPVEVISILPTIIRWEYIPNSVVFEWDTATGSL